MAKWWPVRTRITSAVVVSLQRWFSAQRGTGFRPSEACSAVQPVTSLYERHEQGRGARTRNSQWLSHGSCGCGCCAMVIIPYWPLFTLMMTKRMLLYLVFICYFLTWKYSYGSRAICSWQLLFFRGAPTAGAFDFRHISLTHTQSSIPELAHLHGQVCQLSSHFDTACYLQ